LIAGTEPKIGRAACGARSVTVGEGARGERQEFCVNDRLLVSVVDVYAAGPVVAVENPAGVFQAAVKIIKRISPKATLIDFHSCGRFHGPSPFFLFWFFFLSWSAIQYPSEKYLRQDRL
jgi:hypothetical protein